MTAHTGQLPSFRFPPIDEVAIAVQFPALEGVTSEHLRSYWKEVRSDYPFVETQLPLIVPLESDVANQPVPEFQVTNLRPRDVRLWLISEADDYLIQVQNSRFIQNWRRRSAEYPRFEEVRDRFWRNYRAFREFLAMNGLPEPKIQQVEVTYINWIAGLEIDQFLRSAGQADVHLQEHTYVPEAQSWSARYSIPDEPDVIKRLYAQAAPAVRADDESQRGTQLTLIVRAADAKGLKDSDVSRLIDDARVIIVNAFATLTTDAAHAVWERLT
jgi:uncharacterized protein (TIGR04255 family)